MTATTPRQRPAVWKLLAVSALALMCIVMVLPGAARAEDPSMSTRDAIAFFAADLQASGVSDKHVDKAIEKLAKALDGDEAWTADGELAAKDGKKVFKAGADAAKELVKAGLADEAKMLAEMFRVIAGDAAGEKSAKHLAKGNEDLDKGKLDEAIDDYAKAWKYALKESGTPGAGAIPAAVGGWLGFDFDNDPELDDFPGTGIVYIFQFVDRNGENPFTVSGWSESKEGFLNSDRFAAADTYTGTATQMQVHVSCSDAFGGGIGQKSDPAEGSQWLVDYAHIAKFSDGEISKECNLVGFDSGLEATDPGPIVLS